MWESTIKLYQISEIGTSKHWKQIKIISSFTNNDLTNVKIQLGTKLLFSSLTSSRNYAKILRKVLTRELTTIFNLAPSLKKLSRAIIQINHFYSRTFSNACIPHSHPNISILITLYFQIYIYIYIYLLRNSLSASTSYRISFQRIKNLGKFMIIFKELIAIYLILF